jgi:DNA-binding transcriptional ArsR family regulator
MPVAADITALDHTLLALADPTRRAILQRLSELPDGEARVTDLAAPFAMSLNAVSKHIRLLERAALVTRRRQGREHLLRFNPAPLTRAERWIADRKAMWESRLDALGDFLAATKPETE